MIFSVFCSTFGFFCFLQDQAGKVPLYWGITADGYVAFADDADLLKGSCGKSLASFPQGLCVLFYYRVSQFSTFRQLLITSILSMFLFLFLNSTGCFYSTAVGGLRCYENPKNKITAVPAEEEEIWGATFKVTRSQKFKYCC